MLNFLLLRARLFLLPSRKCIINMQIWQLTENPNHFHTTFILNFKEIFFFVVTNANAQIFWKHSFDKKSTWFFKKLCRFNVTKFVLYNTSIIWEFHHQTRTNLEAHNMFNKSIRLIWWHSMINLKLCFMHFMILCSAKYGAENGNFEGSSNAGTINLVGIVSETIDILCFKINCIFAVVVSWPLTRSRLK